MVRQLTFSLLLFLAVIACADDYILATGEDGTEIVYTADRMIYTNWLNTCVLWMPFPSDVGGGSYPDYSKEQNNGSQSTAGDRPTWEAGVYCFDGDTDYMTNTFDGMPSVLSNITVTFWAYPQAQSQSVHSVIMASPNNDANRINIHLIFNALTTYWDFGDVSEGGRVSIQNSTWTNVWAHYSFTAESGVGMKIYRNAIEIASTNTSSVFTKGEKTMVLGATATLIDNWHGKLDDFRIYIRALSSNEIYQIYLDAKGSH